jgi:hypothetical protein
LETDLNLDPDPYPKLIMDLNPNLQIIWIRPDPDPQHCRSQLEKKSSQLEEQGRSQLKERSRQQEGNKRSQLKELSQLEKTKKSQLAKKQGCMYILG